MMKITKLHTKPWLDKSRATIGLRHEIEKLESFLVFNYITIAKSTDEYVRMNVPFCRERWGTFIRENARRFVMCLMFRLAFTLIHIRCFMIALISDHYILDV